MLNLRAIDKMDQVHVLEAARQLAATDLKYLCTKGLGFDQWDTLHDELVAWLNQSTKRFKLILMPRETFKSSIITVARSIQRILQNPNTTILLSSAVLANSESFMGKIKEYLTAKSNLKHLFGDFQSDVWNSEKIVIRQRTIADHTPTITPAGADKATVSQHYDLIAHDDLVNRQTVNTKEQIEKTRKVYSDSFDLLKKPDGEMVIVGTRWDDKDLYGEIIRAQDELEKAGKPRTFDIYVRKVKEQGKIIFPTKFIDQNFLDELKREKGSYDFSCQYMNEPISRENQQFKPPVRYWETIPEGGMNFITVDLAGEEEDNDFNVIGDMNFSKANQLRVVEYDRGHYTAGEMIEKLFAMVKRKEAEGRKPRVVGIEAIAYQRVFLQLLSVEMRKRKYYFSTAAINPHKDKFTRIMALQPWWEQGNLLLKPGMVELEEEFDRFPRGLNDDVIDMVSMSVPIVQGTVPIVENKPEYANLKDDFSRHEWEARAKNRERKNNPVLPLGRIGA